MEIFACPCCPRRNKKSAKLGTWKVRLTRKNLLLTCPFCGGKIYLLRNCPGCRQEIAISPVSGRGKKGRPSEGISEIQRWKYG